MRLTHTLIGALSAVLLTATLPATAADRVTLPLLSAKTLPAACERALEIANARADLLGNLPLAEVSVEAVLQPWDRMFAAINDVVGPAYLLSSVHPDEAVRTAGEACISNYISFETALYQQPALYERIKAVSGGDAIDQKLRQDILHGFEDRGVALPPAQRARAAEILDELEQLRQEFSRRLRDNKQTLSFTPAEQTGLPAGYLERVTKDGEGNIVVGFDYPDVYPFLENATDGPARKRYYRAFQRRGGPDNLATLNKIVELRHEYAQLYDLPSYADFVLRRRMANSSAEVKTFLADVRPVIARSEAADLLALRALKAAETGTSLEKAKIEQWDRAYYVEKLRQDRAQIDQESLRAYFPTTAVRDWILDVTQRLYGVEFRRAEAPVWHEDVEYYDLYDAATGEFMSGIYLDLYPRDGKFKHAAAWPVRGSSTLLGRKPYSVLVCNFDRKGLTQDEVETFYHEFGHGMHGILSQTRYTTHAGTSVERDFVEAPSQMFEEWARKRETLALLADHCSDCPELSDDLIKRLGIARRLARGVSYARQHLYASFDIDLYDSTPEDALTVWKRHEGATPYGYVAGTEFPGTFGHIAGGYAAGYYGYMYSEAIGLDLLSAFGNQLMNPQVGAKLRRTIMSAGGEQSAREMVKAFLGREASNETFYEEILGRRK